MSWERCKSYGLTRIDHVSNNVRIYYDQFQYEIAGTPPHILIESASWQGDNLIVRGRNRHGEQKTLILNGQFNYQEI